MEEDGSGDSDEQQNNEDSNDLAGEFANGDAVNASPASTVQMPLLLLVVCLLMHIALAVNLPGFSDPKPTSAEMREYSKKAAENPFVREYAAQQSRGLQALGKNKELLDAATKWVAWDSRNPEVYEVRWTAACNGAPIAAHAAIHNAASWSRRTWSGRRRDGHSGV